MPVGKGYNSKYNNNVIIKILCSSYKKVYKNGMWFIYVNKTIFQLIIVLFDITWCLNLEKCKKIKYNWNLILNTEKWIS